MTFSTVSFKREGGLPRMMNRQTMKSFYKDGRVSSSRTNSMKLKERYAYKSNAMSIETQDFIKKICYRKTASIDMTQHGFISDSKINPVTYVMKPLREQLVKICVKPVVVKRQYLSVLPRDKLREDVTSTERKSPCMLKSALSSPGNRLLRSQCRVRIQSEPIPDPETGQKKVKTSDAKRKQSRNAK